MRKTSVRSPRVPRQARKILSKHMARAWKEIRQTLPAERVHAECAECGTVYDTYEKPERCAICGGRDLRS